MKKLTHGSHCSTSKMRNWVHAFTDVVIESCGIYSFQVVENEVYQNREPWKPSLKDKTRHTLVFSTEKAVLVKKKNSKKNSAPLAKELQRSYLKQKQPKMIDETFSLKLLTLP